MHHVVNVLGYFGTSVCISVSPTIFDAESHMKVTRKVSYKPGVQPLNSLFFRESFSFLQLPSPQESQGPSHSLQSSLDKLIIQFKTNSTKINSTS